MQYIIYGLVDPETDELRYIGKSITGMNRPKKHFYPSTLKSERTYKNKWVNSVLKRCGKLPKVAILAEGTDEVSLNKLEIEFIAHARSLGIRLTNIQNGGDGFTSELAKLARQKTDRSAWVKGGKAAAANGTCARNNLKLRRPIVATHVKSGEQRWYLSASHAAADGLGSRSAISNALRPNWRCKHNKGWTFQYASNLPA
jgi:hypothetical protein